MHFLTIFLQSAQIMALLKLMAAILVVSLCQEFIVCPPVSEKPTTTEAVEAEQKGKQEEVNICQLFDF